MNQVAPQIHIKARFIEVPKEGFVALPQLSSNVVAGQMTGILSDPEFRTVLQALEQHQGVETLAQPECVTTSGRQTQMRATDINEIVTNFVFRETSSNSTSVVPQTGKFEIGPTVGLVPYVLADGYTINLTAKADVLEFLGYDSATNRIYATNNIGRSVSAPTIRPGFRIHEGQATVNLWDNQTLVLGNFKSNFIGGDGQISNESQFFQDMEKKKGTADTELLVFITATIVDPAGNRVHSDDEMRQIQERTKSYAPPQPNISSPSR
jgi:Flp pilus assembly secretin CpaC